MSISFNPDQADLTRSQLSVLVSRDGLLPIDKFKTPFPRSALTDSSMKGPSEEEYVIYNLSNDVLHGTHWVASCNVKGCEYIEYFDSYGLAPPEDILHYLERSGKQVFYNTVDLQVGDETDCGYFCLYYLSKRYQNCSIYDIIYHYNKSRLSSV